MTTPEQAEERAAAAPSLLTVAHEWGRIVEG